MAPLQSLHMPHAISWVPFTRSDFLCLIIYFEVYMQICSKVQALRAKASGLSREENNQKQFGGLGPQTCALAHSSAGHHRYRSREWPAKLPVSAAACLQLFKQYRPSTSTSLLSVFGSSTPVSAARPLRLGMPAVSQINTSFTLLAGTLLS